MINDNPDTAAEMRRAAMRLEEAKGGGSRSPSWDARIEGAIELIRAGSLELGRRKLEDLAAQGSMPAAKILSWLDDYGPDAVSKDDRMHQALTDIRRGEVGQGFHELVKLADDGYAPAAHFLAWLHRYRAAELLKDSAARFRQALDHGYRPSQLHLAQVEEALNTVDFVPGGPPSSSRRRSEPS